ncbi:MAG: hypothetical protein ACJ76Q_07760 [Solirubrobacteraceae bacterium]
MAAVLAIACLALAAPAMAAVPSRVSSQLKRADRAVQHASDAIDDGDNAKAMTALRAADRTPPIEPVATAQPHPAPIRRLPQRRATIPGHRARSPRSRPLSSSLRRCRSPTVPKGRKESYPRRNELSGDRQARSFRTRDLAAAAGAGPRSGAEAEARSRAGP